MTPEKLQNHLFNEYSPAESRDRVKQRWHLPGLKVPSARHGEQAKKREERKEKRRKKKYYKMEWLIFCINLLR